MCNAFVDFWPSKIIGIKESDSMCDYHTGDITKWYAYITVHGYLLQF